MTQRSPAIEQIHRELALEAQVRGRRSWLVASVFLLLVVLGCVVTGASFRPGAPLTLAVGALALALWLVLSLDPAREIRAWVTGGLAILGLAAPLLPYLWHQPLPVGAVVHGGGGCAVLVSLAGLLAIAVARSILGSTVRRFGGARDLLALSAAGAAVAGVSLGCKITDLGHLLTHVGGWVLVLLVALAFLRGPRTPRP